jgi:two-component system OmpR family sensor kinase
MKSIRSQLLIWQIGALVLTGLLISLVTYEMAQTAFNDLRDDSLKQITYSILRHGVVSDDNSDSDDEKDPGQFISQIWGDDGKLQYSSLAPAVGPPPQKNGLNVVLWENEEWHMYTLRNSGLIIQVGNPSSHRQKVFARIIQWMLLPLILLVAGLGGLIWAAVGRALIPLKRVQQEIGRRDAPVLHALETEGLPDEVAPLVGALNDLLGRLDTALSSQRRFIADAAHELRTPLTAIKLRSQLMRQSTDPAEWAASLTQLESGVERASHLIDQLLRMARLEPDIQPQAFAVVQLDELAKKVVAEFSTQADARAIDMGITRSDKVAVRGHPDSLRIMLNNLVDNALRYTPGQGQVDVAVRSEGDQAVLTVADTGPGIPEAEHERVFDRFYRLAQADIPGSGLGLAIVRQVAEAHGGQVTLSAAPEGGLLVTVRLPAVGGESAPPAQ